MKIRHRILTLLSITLLLGIGCRRHEYCTNTKWGSTEPTSDSLTQRMDYLLFHHHSVDEMTETLTEFEKHIERQKGNTSLKNRANYFRAFIWLREGKGEESLRLLQELLSTSDSASDPYLYNRTLHLADPETERSVAAYDKIAARMKYFESTGDAFMTAAHLTELGNLLKDVRDPEGAISAYRKADSLYRVAGYADNATLNRMNIASATIVKGDTVRAAKIYKSLLNDSIIKALPDMRAKVYHNLAVHTGDTEAIDSVISIMGEDTPAIIRAFEAQRYLKQQKYEAAIVAAEHASTLAADEGDADALAYAEYALADAYSALGRKDEAFDYLQDAVELTDAITIANEPDQIRALETGRLLSLRVVEAELHQSQATLFWVCVSFALLLMLLITIQLVRTRIRKLRAAHQQASDERDKVSRRLVATQAAMDESSRLITDVGKQIGDMADNGEIPYGPTQPIVNAIKSHAVREGAREAFVESFTYTNPGFAIRLREMNDAISETDIRLAAYVASGMDNKQIAATMGIRPESVKQARWRLRSKLGLKSGERLEDVLREIADSGKSR